MEVEIEKIVYPGLSLARQKNTVIFTDEGLPKEVVEVRTIKKKKNYLEAKTVNILKPSRYRVNPLCSHYKVCSPYQYIDYNYQLEIKKEQIEEIIFHNVKDKPPTIIIKGSKCIWGYRNRTRLHLFNKKGKSYFSYHLSSHLNKFIEIEECFLLSLQINSLLNLLFNLINSYQLYFIEEIEIKESYSTKEMLINIYTNVLTNTNEVIKRILNLRRQLPMVTHCLIKNSLSGEYEIIWGKNFIKENILNTTYSIGPTSFFQINIPSLIEMIEDIKNLLNFKGKETVIDLYCGIGTFGLAISPLEANLVLVEYANDYIPFLEDNLRINRKGKGEIYNEDSQTWLTKNLNRKIDILIVDPPRAGLGKSMCETILKSSIPLILYISCNPSTFIRDIRELYLSYKLKYLQIYDFFPHTPHMETVGILTNKKSKTHLLR
ncbi:MAG: 23S rRNA (uracil(1939)-C(5))-methyltransferase RlmD [Candidatus Omnitrophica bacterium]|nr:23S rRNA (uracil(1939)-C(5))-methyltransferase RlmD [Candidatus Omnitrophota bacterium]MCM8823684.1 23S rRNA (uracil(1939)-C(5))-methyltransferase RlmD [Candidatus Omnitrophota bacterium]MCM8826739.1 23S rRNA (uracil(1939)-C(5))-methyltransferase RlmD [Candidatus Omnitrophota bacterium]